MGIRTRVMGAVVACIAAGLPALAGGPILPDGKWSGTADWRGPKGTSGSYTVERAFEGQVMRSRFAWNEGRPRTEEHTVSFSIGKDPVFEVLDGSGQVVGKGYCHDEACAYHASFGGISVDESFRWSADAMTVLGSKAGPGFAVVWKETLAR